MAKAITGGAPITTVRVIGGTLFDIALRWLGDAQQWDRIASLNGLSDPWLAPQYYELQIPRRVTNNKGSISGRQ